MRSVFPLSQLKIATRYMNRWLAIPLAFRLDAELTSELLELCVVKVASVECDLVGRSGYRPRWQSFFHSPPKILANVSWSSVSLFSFRPSSCDNVRIWCTTFGMELAEGFARGTP